MSSFQNCTQVSLSCPVPATTYGYYPSLGPNSTLLAVFAILLCAQLILTCVIRVYSHSLVVAAACFIELLGYIGRAVMHFNPWIRMANRLQIVCFIIGPSFNSVGIYLTLKHTIIHYGSQYSRLEPKLYT